MGWLDGVTKVLSRGPRSWRGVPRLLEGQRNAPEDIRDDVARVLDGVWPFPGLLLQIHRVGPIWYIAYSKRKRFAWLHGEHVRQAESYDATVQGLLRTMPNDQLFDVIDPLWQHFYGRPVLMDEAARDVQLTGDDLYEPAEPRLLEEWHAPQVIDGEMVFYAVAVSGLIQKVYCGLAVRFERICHARRSKVV